MNKVRGYRVMCNMTQDDMALVLGMSKRTYLDKESGKREFTLTEFKKIKEIINDKGINVTLDDLS